MTDDDLVERARTVLQGMGIDSSWGPRLHSSGRPHDVTLRRGSNTETYAAMFQPRPSLASVAHVVHQSMLPVLLVGGRVSSRSAMAFREARIQYVDALGNAFVHFGDVYVDVQGRRGDSENRVEERATGETNLFSSRRAQVICAVLSAPSLLDRRQQDLADASGVSIGLAHDTLTLLRRAGFLGVSGLRKSDNLLDLWASAYPGGLGATLELDRFVGDPSPRHVAGTGTSPEPSYSGEAAVGPDLARRLTLTVYVDRRDDGLALANRWRRDPEKRSNVFVRRRFWRDVVDLGETAWDGRAIAPWPLVYADLLSSNEPRLSEVAERWRERHAT